MRPLQAKTQLDLVTRSLLLTENEIKAVQDYIDQGGRIFLVGIGWVWTTYEKKSIEEYPLNRIVSQYGIFFDSDISCESNTEKVVTIDSKYMDLQHPIAKSLQLIGSGVSGVTPAAVGTLRVKSPAHAVISCGKATPILAVAQTEKGKIVALQHHTFVWEHLNSQKYNNYELLRNILTWLVD